MFICFLSLFVSIQVSDAYVNILSVILLFSLNFRFFDIFLFLNSIKLLYQNVHMEVVCSVVPYTIWTVIWV